MTLSQLSEMVPQCLISGVNNKSLLAVGVTALEGSFSAGDVISILDAAGGEIARGVANYSSDDVAKILGFKTSDDIISKDNLVVL